jgi:hypothetical protein
VLLPSPDLENLENFTPCRPKRRGNPNQDWIARRGQRTISEKHADFEVSVDRAKAQGRQCVVKDCHKPCEDFCRWCQFHRDRRRKTGSAEGRQLRRRWLKPYVAVAAMSESGHTLPSRSPQADVCCPT